MGGRQNSLRKRWRASHERRQAQEATTSVGCGTGSIRHTTPVGHRPERGTKIGYGGLSPRMWAALT